MIPDVFEERARQKVRKEYATGKTWAVIRCVDELRPCRGFKEILQVASKAIDTGQYCHAQKLSGTLLPDSADAWFLKLVQSNFGELTILGINRDKLHLVASTGSDCWGMTRQVAHHALDSGIDQARGG
jgi:hypothetical protein